RKREVVVRARIDEQVDAERAHGEAERIGVAVRGKRAEAELAAVEHHADDVCGAGLAPLKNAAARIGERPRLERGTRAGRGVAPSRFVLSEEPDGGFAGA